MYTIGSMSAMPSSIRRGEQIGKAARAGGRLCFVGELPTANESFPRLCNHGVAEIITLSCQQASVHRLNKSRMEVGGRTFMIHPRCSDAAGFFAAPVISR